MTLKDGLAFWGGPVGFVLALALLPGGEVHQGALAGTAWWMLWWWIGGAVPLGPTSLLPLALFPVFGVMDLSATAAPFGSRFIWLFLGALFSPWRSSATGCTAALPCTCFTGLVAGRAGPCSVSCWPQPCSACGFPTRRPP